MTGQAHADDVLILGSMRERRLFRQFAESQVFTVEQIHRIEGRRIRKAWWSWGAVRHSGYEHARLVVDHGMRKGGGEHRAIETWKPEEDGGLVERIETLTPVKWFSRDYEDGYKAAIDAVLELIHEEAEASAEL